jgi:hypothetical protein
MEMPTFCMSTESKLDYLISLLKATKASEEHERQERIKIEEEIAKLIPGPDRGQKTITLENGTKIIVERGYNYKVDFKALREKFIEREIDCKLPPPIKIKTTQELDIAGYEWYKSNHPELFNAISRCVEVKPKKIAVTVKVNQ